MTTPFYPLLRLQTVEGCFAILFPSCHFKHTREYCLLHLQNRSRINCSSACSPGFTFWHKSHLLLLSYSWKLLFVFLVFHTGSIQSEQTARRAQSACQLYVTSRLQTLQGFFPVTQNKTPKCWPTSHLSDLFSFTLSSPHSSFSMVSLPYLSTSNRIQSPFRIIAFMMLSFLG